MSVDYTTTGLVASIKRRGFLPAGSGLSTNDILQYATEELRNYIPAFLKSIREEYIIATVSLTVTGATVNMPQRAVGAALRTVKWAQSAADVPRQLARIEPERRADYPPTDSSPQGYMFQGNTLILVPAVTSGTLTLAYQQRPGQLVLPTACAKVIEVTPSTVTVESRPNNFEQSSADSPYDFVGGNPNFVAYAIDVDSDSDFSWQGAAPGVVADVNSTLAALISVGDYICLAGETCIPQVPYEVHDLLAQAAASKIAEATGSSRKDSIAKGLSDLRAQLTTILTPRSDGSSRPIISKSRIGRGTLGW